MLANSHAGITAAKNTVASTMKPSRQASALACAATERSKNCNATLVRGSVRNANRVQQTFRGIQKGGRGSVCIVLCGTERRVMKAAPTLYRGDQTVDAKSTAHLPKEIDRARGFVHLFGR